MGVTSFDAPSPRKKYAMVAEIKVRYAYNETLRPGSVCLARRTMNACPPPSSTR